MDGRAHLGAGQGRGHPKALAVSHQGAVPSQGSSCRSHRTRCLLAPPTRPRHHLRLWTRCPPSRSCSPATRNPGQGTACGLIGCTQGRTDTSEEPPFHRSSRTTADGEGRCSRRPRPSHKGACRRRGRRCAAPGPITALSASARLHRNQWGVSLNNASPETVVQRSTVYFTLGSWFSTGWLPRASLLW
jgi:hypothetical protein